MGITGASGGQATLRGSVIGSVAGGARTVTVWGRQSIDIAEVSEACVRRGYGEMIA